MTNWPEGLLAGSYFLLTGIFILLIGGSIYWDDWTVIGVARELNATRFLQAGTPFGWTGHLHSSLSTDILPAYRLGILALWGGICGVFGWITYLHSRNGTLSLIVTVIAAISPFNSARTAIINTPAIICVGAFFAGWLIMRKNVVAAALLFLFSFTLPSLLFFYAVPFLTYAIALRRENPAHTVRAYLNLGLFFLLPFAYWTARSIWFEPKGIYEGYNGAISLQNVLSAGYLVVLDVKHHVRYVGAGWYVATAVLALALVPVSASLVSRLQSSVPPERHRRTVLVLLACGLGMLILATLPYFLVGNSPRWSVWDSRNQILIPFGYALTATSVLLHVRQKLATGLFCLIASVSLLYAGGQGYLLWRDGEKQALVQRMWAESPAVKDAHVVILDDKTSTPFANRRQPGWYELSGILAMAYGDERRIGIEESQWTDKLCHPLGHFAYTSLFYRTGDVPLALAEAPDGIRIVRTTFRDAEEPRSRLMRIVQPFVGVRMEATDARGDCDGVSPDN